MKKITILLVLLLTAGVTVASAQKRTKSSKRSTAVSSKYQSQSSSKAWATYSNGVLTFSCGQKPQLPAQVDCSGCGKKMSFSTNFCSDCGQKNKKDFVVYDAFAKISLSWDDRKIYSPWDEKCGEIVKVIFDSSFKKVTNIKSTACFFYRLRNLTTIIGIENLNTSNVTEMQVMFSGCSSLKKLDLSHFDTSNVTNMHQMFYGCENLESINVSNFKTNKVTDMGMMFEGCKQLKSLDLSSFNTENVEGDDGMTGMYGMFEDCQSLKKLDLSNFNTSKVICMSAMFCDCHSLTELNVSSFDTSNVTDMGGMFSNCYNLETLDLSNFDTRKTTAFEMFSNCYKLKTVYVSAEKWKIKKNNNPHFPSYITLYGKTFKGSIVKK